MRVAVITRTKDRPEFLRRAIKSVTEQTFSDYVHVIINDGGDKSVLERVIESTAHDASKTKVIHRKTASNAPDTIFNESIDRVDSEYFVIHDDDDTWHPDFLATTVKQLDTNSDIGAVVVRTDKVTEEVADNGAIEIKKRTHWMPDLKAISLYRQCIDNQMTPIATLFRRSAYEKVGKFDTTLPVVGDWEFGIRLLLQFDVDYINPGYALAGYHHRKYKAGATSNSSFGGSDEKHRYYSNKIRNKYLRAELAEGHLGVGYIMSKLMYNQNNLSALVGRLTPGLIERYMRHKVRN